MQSITYQTLLRSAYAFAILGLGLPVFNASGAEENAMDANGYPPHPPEKRLVGIAYQTWFPPTAWDYVWGTPELGHYSSDDREVIRQHAAWLYDAGVDFIWIDWSNNVDHDPDLPPGAPILDEDGERYLANRPDILAIETATEILFEEYAQLEERPKIAIFAGAQPAASATDGRLQRKADQIYDTFIANPDYRDMYVTHLGKPLLVVYVGTPSPWQTGTADWDDPRFTVRWMTGFVTEQPPLRTDDLISRHGYWSWEDRVAQTYTLHDGQPEAMVVVASWRQQAEPGEDSYIPARGREDGATFRDQWARAREIGPKFAMVVSWNEWTLGEAVDDEISKDIEPSEEHGHFYLELLKEEIAKFKSETE